MIWFSYALVWIAFLAAVCFLVTTQSGWWALLLILPAAMQASQGGRK